MRPGLRKLAVVVAVLAVLLAAVRIGYVVTRHGFWDDRLGSAGAVTPTLPTLLSADGEAAWV
ncbi:hypothetical protein [Xylanimonas oleitrophica]|uniref:hypothetical protein n=1 Tax=Xylanimonas oleitrophica TaxID=2607479 RepID=UPI0011B36774|nr:hypothetical protein [Xylanimonas oleitrophica]